MDKIAKYREYIQTLLTGYASDDERHERCKSRISKLAVLMQHNNDLI